MQQNKWMAGFYNRPVKKLSGKFYRDTFLSNLADGKGGWFTRGGLWSLSGGVFGKGFYVARVYYKS